MHVCLDIPGGINESYLLVHLQYTQQTLLKTTSSRYLANSIHYSPYIDSCFDNFSLSKA